MSESENYVLRPHHSNFPRFAAAHPDVYGVSADLPRPCELGLFRDLYPERCISLGMAEQNMIGFAGGMAREGLIPYVHTFGVFTTRRVIDQIEMAVAYPNLPVKMLGFLPGIISPGGATHHAIDDVSLMRSIPNMTVIDAGDATEIESVLEAAYHHPGPVYIRMNRGRMRRLFPTDEPLQIDRVRRLSAGEDLTVFSSGLITEHAIRAVEVLKERGLSVEHVHISTLKPFNDPQIADSLRRGRLGAISIENHLITGGLGSALAEKIADEGIGTKLVRIGLRDTYAHGADPEYLLRLHEMDALAVVRAAEDLLGDRLGVDPEDLGAVGFESTRASYRADAL